MTTKKNFGIGIAIFLGLFVVVCSFSCNKKCYRETLFDVPINVSPIKDTYKNGDSVWIDIPISRFQIDQISGEDIDVGYFDFEITVFFFQCYQDRYESALTYFNYVFIAGDYIVRGQTYPYAVFVFDAITMDELQNLRFAILVDEQVGDFGMYFGSAKAGLTEMKKFPHDNCDYIFEMDFNNSAGPTSNIEKYLTRYPDLSEHLGLNLTTEEYQNIGTFFFTAE